MKNFRRAERNRVPLQQGAHQFLYGVGARFPRIRIMQCGRRIEIDPGREDLLARRQLDGKVRCRTCHFSHFRISFASVLPYIIKAGPLLHAPLNRQESRGGNEPACLQYVA